MSTRTSSPFLAAANGQVTGHTPVWFMRQAGRSLPEYRAVRGEGSILDAIKQPELAAAITLQPVRRYGVDAAVLYSDIVVPPHAAGFGIDVTPGTGPVAPDPLRRRADLDRLRPLQPDDIGYVAETVALVSAELGPDVPVLAFAGAPFTVASYLIEGGPSRTYEHTKALLHTDEALWHDVMDRLAAMAVAFIDVQLTSGAQAFQLFDSWAGTLSRADYERYVFPHSQRVFRELGVLHPQAPGIHFGIGCDHLLEAMHRAGPRIMGLDWRTPITAARERLGADLVVQGNLDPALVLAGAEPALVGTQAVLADNAGHPGHVFNLGHGVHPTTDPGVLAAIVDLVHDRDPAMTVGVVLMAYGTPRGPEEIEPYYTDIRRGRPPTPEQLADLTRRYDAIGGISPLAELTSRQGDVLQAALDERAAGTFVVTLGLKHAAPKIEDGVAALAAAGVERVIGLVLAPHHSTMSIGEYLGRAQTAADRAGLVFEGIESWATEPAYVDFLARAVTDGLDGLPPGSRVVFTAHSLPERIIAAGDRYPDELTATGRAVAGRLGLEDWAIGWQSAGRTPEPWIGPDVLAVVDAAAGSVPGLLVCPCGFVADHLEVLYDLDIEARGRAAAAGLPFARTRSMNADPAVLAALADRVVALAG